MTNKTEAYMDAPWLLTFDAEATVIHRFGFSEMTAIRHLYSPNKA